MYGSRQAVKAEGERVGGVGFSLEDKPVELNRSCKRDGGRREGASLWILAWKRFLSNDFLKGRVGSSG